MSGEGILEAFRRVAANEGVGIEERATAGGLVSALMAKGISSDGMVLAYIIRILTQYEVERGALEAEVARLKGRAASA